MAIASAMPEMAIMMLVAVPPPCPERRMREAIRRSYVMARHMVVKNCQYGPDMLSGLPVALSSLLQDHLCRARMPF